MDQAVKAVDRSGLRALLCQGVLDFPIPGVPDPAQNSALAGRFVDTWAGFSSRIQTGIFCHSPYTCSSETLRKVKSLCRQKGVPFFIHVAETREEVSQIQSREGRTPIEYLQALDLLDRQTVAVHAIHLNSREIETLAQTGTAVVHCPESNMKLASGVAPIAQMLKQGIRVGLGTDSSASNNDLDLFKEMDTAAKLEKVHSMDPSLLNARTVLALATSQGADILGLGIQVGSIEIGKDADIVLLDLLTPHLVPCHNPFSLLVYAAQGSDVHSVMIAGRMVVENRQILTFDLSEVLGQVTRISQWISKG
ncbi:MAG: hypothetical protein C0407_17795 [Desulfobacca sp.]|nr:hypothetical protein [Desulfobacca sp.]